MTEPSCINGEHRRLVQAASIDVLRPEATGPHVEYASAHTTTRAGVPVLTGFRFEVREDDGERAARIEANTFVRGGILSSRQDSGSDEAAIIDEYLEREARYALAARSLELADGAAEQLSRPLGELILEREGALPASSPATLSIDGVDHSARTIVHAGHSATWCDIPAARVATIVYTQRWPHPPQLVTLAP